MKRMVVFGPGIAEVGGAARQTRHLIEGFAAEGWKVFVVARAGSFRRFELRRSGGITVLEVPGFRRRRIGAALYLLCALPIGLVLGSRSRALIAVQLYSQAVTAGLCSIVTRTPFIGWTTTSGVLSESEFISRSRIGGVRKRLLNRARFVVAQTPLAARELESVLPTEKIVVIPNPVPVPEWAALSGEPTALYAGRYAREKNILGLLDGWPEVVARVPEARLTLAGLSDEPGSVEPEIRMRVEQDPVCRGSVALLGWVSDPSELLRTHDVYVFPSLTEGMSNSLLDACAQGRVIVASDIEPNRAVLGDDYPLLFPAQSLPALVDSLVVALTDQEVRAAALAAIRGRLELFSVPHVVARWTGLIEGAS